jgi:hypothetical protein
MSINKVKRKMKEKSANKKQIESGWDGAIADARERIRGLHYSIKVFEARKRCGDQWPGDKVATSS